MADTALVTGCSTGIGRATAERFEEAGWKVYATARDPVGTLLGGVVRGRLRDAVTRVGVRALASRPVQWLLENRR